MSSFEMSDWTAVKGKNREEPCNSYLYVVGSFVGSFWPFSVFLTVKPDRKNFGRCKNNGIVRRPLVQICPLFQGKPVIMDAIKLMDKKFS